MEENTSSGTQVEERKAPNSKFSDGAQDADDSQETVGFLHEEEEEEEECRVCRGPAEEGRPLFSPCKCSGSIGLVHQDCLTSWLAVTRGEGRCELCKTKFHFAPQYDESAPTHLAVPDVLCGLARRAMVKWLPFILRSAFCTSLWLLVAPLMTAYLYRIWMHRTFACIQERWKWDLIPSDVVSGAVLAAMILVSFLSLMSFADFLRLEWQWQQQHAPANGIAARIRELLPPEEANRNDNQNIDNRQPDHEVDEGLLREEQIRRLHFDQLQQQHDEREGDVLGEEIEREMEKNLREDEKRERAIEGEEERVGERPNLPGIPDDQRGHLRQREGPAPEHQRQNHADDDADDANQAREVEDQHRPHNNVERHVDEPNDEAEQEPPPPAQPARHDDDNNEGNRIDDQRRQLFGRNNDARLERQFDVMDPVMEDQVDMEINVALDELLGLRGPISSLIRNLLWLLVFNTIYLGFFAFIPKTIGSSVHAILFNTTAFGNVIHNVEFDNTTNTTSGMLYSLRSTIAAINNESNRLNTAFQLPDFATINLGYFSMAFILIVVRFSWILSQKFRLVGRPNEGAQHDDNNIRLNRNENDGNNVINGRDRDRVRAEALNEARQAELQMHVFDEQDVHPLVGDGFENTPFSVSEGVTLILDATVAVVKVGVLLFLKMFLLPVLLGLWLDGSTMDLFGFTMNDRILYAGRDLFSFILLHWVAGITFMLLVTVSVLQLREVTHPDLLAHLIRPQEPQPDLLGNLMHDSVLTQTKRMMLSLAIYTALLNMHVSLPVKLLLSSGITSYLPFLQVKFWHLVMPQLQIPLELLIFHLSMLALLEKYKNSIGEMQHHWLRFMCKAMGLTDYLLPQNVEKFVLKGIIPVYGSNQKVQQCWYDISEKSGKDAEELIVINLVERSPTAPRCFDAGETKTNGDRVLTTSQGFIRLPRRSVSTGVSNDELSQPEGSKLLPTKIGSFRLKRREASATESPAIEVWHELPGRPIARPPEGWDDLGVGGADVQGRWAWGKEKKSTIEEGVAERKHFFEAGERNFVTSSILIMKVLVLLLSSWLVITVLLFVVVAFPLALGRFVYCILRVQERFIHYPLSFAVGSCMVFPSIALGAAFLVSSTNGNDTLMNRIAIWLLTFHLPSRRKILVIITTGFLWFVFCPIALGMIYELNLVKSSEWFAGEEPFVSHVVDVCLCWTVGFVLLNAWACLCSLSVFTKEFWINIGNGMLDAPPNEDAAADVQVAANNNELNDAHEDENIIMEQPRWQGKEGRISKLFSIWKSILLRWEWDAVDHVPMIHECALPVAKQLSIPLVVSSLYYAAWLLVSSIFGSYEEYGQYRRIAFRISCAVTVMAQLCITFDYQIRAWFRAAHKAARDDRYLIGEILLNYDPTRNS